MHDTASNDRARKNKPHAPREIPGNQASRGHDRLRRQRGEAAS